MVTDPWQDPQTRSNQFLKKKTMQPEGMQLPFHMNTITSLKPSTESLKTAPIAEPINRKTNSGGMAWLNDKWHSILNFCGWKSASVKALDVQQDYVKKSEAVAIESTVRSTALKSNTSQVQSEAKKITSPPKEEKKSIFSRAWGWVKDKWNSFLEFVGIRKPAVQAIERDRTKRARIRENHSTRDEEEFKYIDLSNVDPLKVMIAILIRQGELKEEQALLIKQKILLMQEDMKDLHTERMQIHAELALVGKRAGVIEKVSVGVTVGQVIAGLISTATVVASAATIATGGVASPLLLVTGVLNGILYGAQAVNTWLRGDTKEKMNKLQGDMLSRTATRDEFQFQLKVDVKDMRKILGAIINHAETGSAVLAAQRENIKM